MGPIMLLATCLQLCFAISKGFFLNGSSLPTKPTQTRRILLYSRNGFFLMITKDGTISYTRDQNNPDAILEMESYSVKNKKIRKPNSWYLVIDKHGKMRTRKKARKDSFFIEHHHGNYLWYENMDNGYLLNMKKNGTPKEKVRKNPRHKKKTHFIITYP